MKDIIVLGSTGSVGKKTLNVIKKNKKIFSIKLLSTNKNVNLVFKQAKLHNVKNIIISDSKSYLIAKKKFKNIKIKIYNNFENIKNILDNKKVDYSMVAISGIHGLKPTLILTKFSKNLAIVNKESLICGWNLIKKNLDKYKTNFIPIDSEHFSIFSIIKNIDIDNIDKIFITASGGPFLDYTKKKFNSIDIKSALKHPNWKMGKKITIDSSTLMNKVFEILEARNIFNLSLKKLSILTHPSSYIHALIKFKNGLIKIAAHEPEMIIPIYNSMYEKQLSPLKTSKLNIEILNNLKLKKVDKDKFPLVNILNKVPNHPSLFDTVIVTVNDYFVDKFLKKEISYNQLIFMIYKMINLKDFDKFKKIRAKNLQEINKIINYVSLKLEKIGI